jgi:hypothetical protein
MFTRRILKMTELYELPSRPAARVAVCRKSIEDALSMGFSLRECATRLDIKYKTFWQAWREARFTVPEDKQLPLPVPVPAPLVPITKPAQEKPKVDVATDYGGFDKPKPKRVFDDDQQGEAR